MARKYKLAAIGVGKLNYSSAKVDKISGKHSAAIDSEKIEDRNYEAIITRDNIALLETVKAGERE